MTPITIVTMIWTGKRAYTLAQAAVMAHALARRTTVPYRFVVLSDQEPCGATPGYEVWPLPADAHLLAAYDYQLADDYPSCFPKMWLFADAAACLGPTVLYLDADVIVCGDLAPLATYAPEAPFVGMTTHGKLQASLYRLHTGRHEALWQAFCAHLVTMQGDPARPKSDQAWLRKAYPPTRHVSWPETGLGLYSIKDLEVGQYPTRLPGDARIVYPTGKVKPWHPRFHQRHPWVQRFYPLLP